MGGADPAGRDDRVARDERAGRGLRPGRRCAPVPCCDGDDFVVNGQKVWTSGAHDADVLLTFVRTDPDAPKHKGISVLMIPTDTARRGAAAVRVGRATTTTWTSTRSSSTTSRVPAENLVGPLNERLAGGQRIARATSGTCCG